MLLETIGGRGPVAGRHAQQRPGLAAGSHEMDESRLDEHCTDTFVQ